MYGVGKKVIEIWAILGSLSIDEIRDYMILKNDASNKKDPKSLKKQLAMKNHIKNGPYLDNFLTNPIHILVYLKYLGSESPEYAKICMGLVRKLSRYGRF